MITVIESGENSDHMLRTGDFLVQVNGIDWNNYPLDKRYTLLTELGEGTQGTRRRASLAELIPNPQDAPLVQVVLKRLVDARLITVARESAEVAHEALIREWDTLQEWLNENREGLRLHRQLTQAAQEWDKLDRDPEALYRGARLAQALEMIQAHSAELNTLEQVFLEASQAEQMAQQTAETARQQRELEAAQALTDAQRQRAEAEQRRAEEQTRAASRLRRRAVYLALAFGASLILLITAIWLGQLANRNAQPATGSVGGNASSYESVSGRWNVTW